MVMFANKRQTCGHHAFYVVKVDQSDDVPKSKLGVSVNTISLHFCDVASNYPSPWLHSHLIG